MHCEFESEHWLFSIFVYSSFLCRDLTYQRPDKVTFGNCYMRLGHLPSASLLSAFWREVEQISRKIVFFLFFLFIFKCGAKEKVFALARWVCEKPWGCPSAVGPIRGTSKGSCSNNPINACECLWRSIFSSFKLCKSSHSDLMSVW